MQEAAGSQYVITARNHRLPPEGSILPLKQKSKMSRRVILFV